MTTLRLERALDHDPLDFAGMAAMTGLTPATAACASRLIMSRILVPFGIADRQSILYAMGLASPVTPPCGMYGTISTSLERYCEQTRPEQFELLTAMLMERLRMMLPEEICEWISEKAEV